MAMIATKMEISEPVAVEKQPSNSIQEFSTDLLKLYYGKSPLLSHTYNRSMP
jgi:hypothetical protein